ncbi:MAG: hypothetical protein GF364_08425 [Candidatus Lokiarchaeota archaeon]|nr:hypothetical protein [Candidatus Lokiarchaeota archaeon]
MITGIRRRETAEESTKSMFQTAKMIISHFRRDADKKKIYELSSKENNLIELLIASTSVHIYHYLGIHTIDPMDSGNISISSVDNVEKMEKNQIYNEIKRLLGNAIELEIQLMQQENDLMKNLLKNVIDAENDISDTEFEELRVDLEDQLVNILNKYPYVYFFDFTGNLLGYLDIIRQEIVKRSSGLRAISKVIEDALVEEGVEDSYIELSLLKGVKDRMMRDFEFSSKKDLQMETVPIKMITNQILKHLFNGLPTSKRALENWLDAMNFTDEIINKFIESNQTKTDYELFEFDIINIIKTKMRQISLDKNSNDLIYFIQYLSDKKFHEVIEMFTRFGVNDIPEFCNLFQVDANKFFNVLKMYGIGKMDLVKLANPFTNPIKSAENSLRLLKKGLGDIQDKTLDDILSNHEKFGEILDKIATDIDWDAEKLRKLYRKQYIIDQKIIKKNNISTFSSLVLLHDHEEIVNNIAREIYFILFAKIARNISRILETYIEIKEDISLYLLGVKRINSLQNENDDWVAVKIEELMIQRIMNRQKELAIVFDAERKPFVVNGFILARFLDSSLSDCIETLKTEPSAVYFDVKPITLPENIISPISYCIAFDLLHRFKEKQENRLLHVESASKKEDLKSERKKKEIREAQQQNTFNWIDRKISSSIMRITSKGINPTTLYWSDKDNQVCADNMKLHSESGGDVTDLFTEFYYFALTRMKENWSKVKIPEKEKLREKVKDIINSVMAKRLKIAPEQINVDQINSDIIAGERIMVAEELAKMIGKKLDKILYKKFKKNRK